MTTRPPADEFTTCEEHGRHRWEGDLVCTACGMVYVQPAQGLGPVPDFCGCKARLLPPARKGDEAKWSARRACHQCAIAQDKR